MKSYCTRPGTKCAECSLTNYGLDCANNPIRTRITGTSRERNMMAAYKGHRGSLAMAAVEEQIPAELADRLTGRELGLVMTAVNAAYHNGRASCGAEVVDGDFLWINTLNRGYDLAVLRAIPE